MSLPQAREQKLLEQMRMKGHTFVDVGANWGSWSLNLAKDFDRVLAFEPDPRVFPTLKQNIVKFGFGNIKPCQIALGNKTESVPLFLFKPSHSTLLPFFQMKRTNVKVCPSSVMVQVYSLDSFRLYASKQVDLIKVDTEGFEIKVLEGAKETIASCKPSLFIEYHSDENAAKVVSMFPNVPFVRIAKTGRGWLMFKK